MLRVCGITYDHTTNYGSCFQAYALQTAIEHTKVGNDEACEYELIPLSLCKDYPKKRLAGRMLMRFYHRSFAPFEKKYQKFAKCSLISNLDQLNDTTDAFVCGSDVIWNTDHNRGIPAYFLDFARKYSFSYAASFGKSSVDEKTIDQIKPYLTKLNEISVREESAAEIIRDSAGRESRVVLDPTLLLPRDEWDRFSAAKQKNKYIFVDTTHDNPEVAKLISRLCENNKLKVITAAWGPRPSALLRKGVVKIFSPEKWLQLLRNAEYVITNSFHATAFSVQFHKKFFTVVSGDKTKGINVRMNDFLTAIGLQDRLFSAVPNELDLSEIDYTEADKKIDAMRKESLDFLRENLEAAYRQKTESERQG